MELTIAIWKDCKRLLTDNQPITCDRLQSFANINVHEEIIEFRHLLNGQIAIFPGFTLWNINLASLFFIGERIFP